MILHTLVVEHVAAYLAAPFYLLLTSLDLCLCLQALLHRTVVELTLQQLQGALLVLRLVACLCVLYQYLLLLACVGIGVPVTQSDARLHLVHILAAGAAAAERVPRQLRRIDIHLDGIVDEGTDEDAGKGCHALALSIEGTDAHQAVHAVLALQVSIGILAALNLHGYALDAGIVALQQARYSHLVAVGLSPPHVHTHQHLCPVLALCATGAAVDLQHTVHRVLLLPQHVHHLQVLDGLQRLLIVGIHLLLAHHLLLEEVKGQLQFVCSRAYIIISFYPTLDTAHLFHLFLGALRVVPEVGSLRSELLFFQLHLSLVNLQIVAQFIGSVEHVFQLFLRNHAAKVQISERNAKGKQVFLCISERKYLRVSAQRYKFSELAGHQSTELPDALMVVVEVLYLLQIALCTLLVAHTVVAEG